MVRGAGKLCTSAATCDLKQPLAIIQFLEVLSLHRHGSQICALYLICSSLLVFRLTEQVSQLSSTSDYASAAFIKQWISPSATNVDIRLCQLHVVSGQPARTPEPIAYHQHVRMRKSHVTSPPRRWDPPHVENEREHPSNESSSVTLMNIT